MKALVICDSFKGTLSSLEVGQIVSSELCSRGIETTYYPISDGGEGFLDVMQYSKNLAVRDYTIQDPLGKPHAAKYLYDETNQTAYLELAECSGLTLIKASERNPFLASTYGFGELIKYIILHHQPLRMILGIGGSATCDGGAGMLEALGVRFYQTDHQVLQHLNNQALKEIVAMEDADLQALIKDIEFIALSDVTNPLLGKNGAIYTFAPQKGAKASQLATLEANLRHFHQIVVQTITKDNAAVSGSGAAGGTGYALVAFLNSRLTSGIDMILDELQLQEQFPAYDVVITGEGKVDAQSVQGKVLNGILNHQPKRLIVLSGSKTVHIPQAEIYSIVPEIASLEESLAHPKECLCKLLEKISI